VQGKKLNSGTITMYEFMEDKNGQTHTAGETVKNGYLSLVVKSFGRRSLQGMRKNGGETCEDGVQMTEYNVGLSGKR